MDWSKHRPNPKSEDLHPMVKAIIKHEFDQVCEIVRGGFDLSEAIHGCGTALHVAAAFGTARTLKLLLDLDAEVQEVNKHGETALHLAAGSVCDAALKAELLIKAGVSVHARNNNNVVAIHIAVRNGQLETVRMLIAAGTNPTSLDHESSSAFDVLEVFCTELKTSLEQWQRKVQGQCPGT